MLGEDEFLLRTPLDLLKLRVQRFGAPLGAEEQELGRRASFALRVALEQGDPEVTRTALALERALFGGGGFALDEPAAPFSARSFEAVVARLVQEIEGGRVVVSREGIESLAERTFDLNFELPPLPPPPKESETTFFEVRFVDEIGQAISGVGVEFKIDGEFRDVTTNAAGVALLEDVKSSTAEVRVAEPSELEKVLDPRWSKPRPGKPPKEANTTRLQFEGAPVGPLGVKAVIPNTVVLEPPRGRLFVQLFDKAGRTRLADLPYTIEGPENFSGKTDTSGSLVHEQVFHGDYTLKFTLEFFEGKDKKSDAYQSPLVVLSPSDATPEIRKLGAVPRSVLAQAHAFFNTNKAFLLPTALPSLHELRALYLESTPGKLLVVGHADTKGGADFNDKLSLERAKATIAYLKDDVDAWLKFYEASVPDKKRWGKVEDRLMLTALPDFRSKPRKEDSVTWFQRTRKLQVDGTAGSETRRQLVTEYMGLDGVSLSELAPEIEAVAHGCGENFPLDDTGENLDAAPEDEKRDPGDRRVELFFFDAEFGIVPAPPGENSKPKSEEYPAWRKGVNRIIDLEAGELDGPHAIFVELVDSLFRTNSAVVLPEGETPSGEKHESLTSVGAFATLLRFVAEREGVKLLVAGHCDTTSTIDFNQKLSEERARCALAVLTGDRESWKTLCDGRHTVGDYKQILSWVSRAFPSVPFACDPGKIDDVEATGEPAVKAFQNAYNENKAAIGAQAADLVPDGDVGLLTWGAFFDCYEFALREELGEDTAGLAELRKKLVFVDDKHKALGFSEHFPIEELGVDNYKSQANRRVELLTFEPGEEPDVEHAAKDPATSELYLPGMYVRKPVSQLSSAVDAERPTGVRVPMRYSKRKSFPKPGALPALKAARDALLANPEATLVIVGHTDPTGTDPTNQKLSLERAEAARAWLTRDLAFFLARFRDDDPKSGWEWEEIQWMLHGVRVDGLPCYVGEADGFPGRRTTEALGVFQLTKPDLALSYVPDEPTMTALCEAYLALMGDGFVDAARIQVLGGGSWHTPVAFGGGEVPNVDPASRDLRRIECFVFPKAPKPPVESFPKLRAAPTVYRSWSAQVVQEIAPERPAFHLEAFDPDGVVLAGQSITVGKVSDTAEESAFGSLTTDALGRAEITAPPGSYAAQVQAGGDALFTSFAIEPDDRCGASLAFLVNGGLTEVTSST